MEDSTKSETVKGDNGTNGNDTEVLLDNSSNFVPYKEVLITIEFVVLFPIIIGNLLIIISLARFRRLRDRMNLLVGNLAAGDLLTGIVVIPYDIAFLLDDGLAKHRFTCLLRLVFLTTSFLLTLLNLMVISIERYIAVIHPFLHFTEEKLLQSVVAMWIFTLSSALIPVFGLNTWAPGLMCSLTYVWTGSYTIFISALSLGTILINTFLFLRVIQVSWDQIDATMISTERNQSRSMDILRTKLMGLVFVVFAVFWGPFFFLIGIRETLGLEENMGIRIALRFLMGLGVTNSGVNWIIYGFKNREFRNAFRRLLHYKHHMVDVEENQRSEIRITVNDSTREQISVISSPEFNNKRNYTHGEPVVVIHRRLNE